MAATVKDPALWWHVKILYSCLLFITAGTTCGLWLCFTEVYNLRRDFDHEILHSDRAVEFGNLGQHVYAEEDNNSHAQGWSEGDRRIREEDGDMEEDDDSESSRVGGQIGDSEDQLIRVKRRAGRRRKLKEGPTFLNSRHWGKEGSGAPEDWVWLTSYSRIPVRYWLNA